MLHTKISSFANPNPAPVKVVMIEYHHIQTDVSNFKSVVQSLTGNDNGNHSCTIAEVEAGQRRKRQRVDQDTASEEAESARDGSRNRSCSASTLLQNSSFKDLDRLLKLELPSMEDFTWIWAD